MEKISEIMGSNRTFDLAKSERAEVIKQIYALYTSVTEKAIRKRDNWKRYCEWCRTNKYPDNEIHRKIFRMSHNFLKGMPIGSFCFFLSHLGLSDLYYCLSICKDRNNRGESVAMWIMSQCKIKK